jgi:hypothetical protein
MADLTITAANVAKGSDATVVNGTFGATVTQGQSVYKDTADNNHWKLAQSDTAAKAGSGGVGVALNSGADGQPCQVITSGDNFVPGATLAVGTRYFVSGTAGGIQPHGDVGSTEFVTLLGIASSTSVLKMNPVVSGAQVP